MKKFLSYISVFFMLSLCSFSAEPEVSLGAGILNSDSPYKGASDENIIFPLVEVDYENFYFKKTELGYVALSDQSTKVSFFVDFWDGYSVDGNDLSQGYDRIEDRDRQILGGFLISYSPDYYYLYDVILNASVGIGEHGNKISLGASKPEMYFNNQFIVIPSLELNILNDNYSDYYFGVDDNEAFLNSRISDSYDPDISYTLNAVFTTKYFFNEFWSFYTLFGMEYLGSEINDSPIISDEFIYTVSTGMQYKF